MHIVIIFVVLFFGGQIIIEIWDKAQLYTEVSKTVEQLKIENEELKKQLAQYKNRSKNISKELF